MCALLLLGGRGGGKRREGHDRLLQLGDLTLVLGNLLARTDLRAGETWPQADKTRAQNFGFETNKCEIFDTLT